MRALEVEEFGGPEKLKVRDVPKPEADDDEVLVKTAYAGVNFTDIYRSRGDYKDSPTYPTPLPYRLGVEGCGWVEAVGKGVTRIKEGDRVAFTRVHGSQAEYVAIPAIRATKLPDGLSFKRGIAVMSHGITAHYLAHDAYPLEPSSKCLIHAAAGGVGQILVQLAKKQDAEVFCTVGSPEKVEIAKSRGADHVIEYSKVNFRDQVMQITGGGGVDVVYDSVGKDTLIKSLNSLRLRGFCILYGHASGLVENFDVLELAEAGSVFLTRPHLQHYVPTEKAYQARAQDLLAWLQDGTIDVTIDRVFQLEEAADAIGVLANRLSKGKVLYEVFGED
ncbi:MAG: quinone oxidoreductase family protein [Alphaproteobacteria bacterium]